MKQSFLSRTVHRCLAVSAILACAFTASAHADWGKIREGGILKVAVYKDFAPFSDVVQGATQGVDVQIAQALADKLGLKLSLLPFDAGEEMGDDLRNMVWKGHYLGYGPAHLMLHVPVDKAFMQKHDKALIFGQYYRETVVMLHDRQKLPELSEAKDLLGVPLATERGSAAASALLGAQGGALRDQVRIQSSTADAVKLLLNGQVAAVYSTRAQLEGALRSQQANTEKYKISPLPLNGVPAKGWVVGMAVKDDERDMAKAIEAALNGLQADGTLQTIFARAGLTYIKP